MKGGVWGLPQKQIEILGSEKCILVDSGDGFAMDNRESKKTVRSDRGVQTPCPCIHHCLHIHLTNGNVWLNSLTILWGVKLN